MAKKLKLNIELSVFYEDTDGTVQSVRKSSIDFEKAQRDLEKLEAFFLDGNNIL